MISNELNYFIRLTALTIVGFMIASITTTKVIYMALGERPIEAIESPIMMAKETAARANPSINHLFVGSSATWRQIDPLAFDSSVAAGIGSYSFNLGNDGLYPMRSVSYLEHLIETLPDRIEVIFFELYALDGLSFNYNSPELMRITNLGNFVDVAETILKANFPHRAKLHLLFEYLRSFLSKSMGFGLVSYQQFERDLPLMHAERLSRTPRGFYAKDVELGETTFYDNRAKLMEVGSVIQKQPELLQNRRAAHIEKYKRAWNLDPNPFANKLQQLLGRAQARGIRLIYFVPPLLTPAGISFAYPTFLLMPEGSRLDLSDPAKLPEVYEADNVFDLEHVNSHGAAFLSRYFAEEYSRLLRKDYQPDKSVDPSN
ncbi:MAG: hypothetical protein P8Y61_06810 [Gammaproteobacteria bacterium]|jgi:hypothetical protein